MKSIQLLEETRKKLENGSWLESEDVDNEYEEDTEMKSVKNRNVSERSPCMQGENA